MTRTTKILACTYVVKGDAVIHKADVPANTVEEATTILSKYHGKKGCAVILSTITKKATYEMPDEVFFANATLVSITEDTTD